jgi:hypothetical protein
MAITKLGNDYLEKTSAQIPLLGLFSDALNASTRIGRTVFNPLINPKSQVFKFFVRKLPKGTYKGVRAGTKQLLRGAEYAGNAIVNKPQVALPIAGSVGVAAYGLNDKMKRNMLHTNHRLNLTTYDNVSKGIMGRINPTRSSHIRYRDPLTKQFYRQHNPYF